MGTLFRALIGFVLAFGLLHPNAFASHFDTSRLAQVRTELASQHPARRLRSLFEDAATARAERAPRR